MGTHVFLHSLASRLEQLFNIATELYGLFNGPTPGGYWVFGIHVALLALDLTRAPATRWLTIWAVSVLLRSPNGLHHHADIVESSVHVVCTDADADEHAGERRFTSCSW